MSSSELFTSSKDAPHLLAHREDKQWHPVIEESWASSLELRDQVLKRIRFSVASEQLLAGTRMAPFAESAGTRTFFSLRGKAPQRVVP